MSDLSELIKTTKNIERQNKEIIRLLKKIAGEDDGKQVKNKIIDFTPDFGELFISNDKSEEETVKKEPEKVENTLQIGTLLENSIDTGEVYFVDGEDIFRLAIKDNETIIDNLTGDGEANDFALQEQIAKESIEKDIDLEDNSVILSRQQTENLPETIRICVEQGAAKVYMPLYASSQLLGAPQIVLDILEFDFYKNEEHLLEILF